MFKNFDFEQVHPSKKAAFTDGALTATLVVSTIAWWWSQRQSDKSFLEGWETAARSKKNYELIDNSPE